jgi:hypothetical protein
VFNFCVDYKRKHGYRQLSVRLQQMEAEVMEEVCLDLHHRGIDVLTVFDSIIVKDEDTEEAREVFRNAFGGLKPEIEAEERSAKYSQEVGTRLASDRPACVGFQAGGSDRRLGAHRICKHARPRTQWLSG